MYYGKVITAAVPGRRIVPTTCDRCGTRFYYELIRVGVGKGSAVYGIGQQGATERATVAAQRNLIERLRSESELVPCPA